MMISLAHVHLLVKNVIDQVGDDDDDKKLAWCSLLQYALAGFTLSMMMTSSRKWIGLLKIQAPKIKTTLAKGYVCLLVVESPVDPLIHWNHEKYKEG